jgi:hypothetical protein
VAAARLSEMTESAKNAACPVRVTANFRVAMCKAITPTWRALNTLDALRNIDTVCRVALESDITERGSKALSRLPA